MVTNYNSALRAARELVRKTAPRGGDHPFRPSDGVYGFVLQGVEHLSGVRILAAQRISLTFQADTDTSCWKIEGVQGTSTFVGLVGKGEDNAYFLKTRGFRDELFACWGTFHPDGTFLGR